MISKKDLERVLAHEPGNGEVVSLFMDMSVNSDNKRTHQIFLKQRKAQLEDLESSAENVSRPALSQFFDRIAQWLDTDFAEENRGVVIYAEIGGDWFEALQFPVPVSNRLVIGRRPVIGPLAEVIRSYEHHGVVLLDREHVRILSVYLGTLLNEVEVHGEPHPPPRSDPSGGFSQTRFQRRKLEEIRQFFKEFAVEVENFIRRYSPDDLIILGTDENVGQFRAQLPEALNRMVIYTGHMAADEPANEVLERIEPHVQAERERESRELVEVLIERVDQDYLATAGFQSTLVALQEGKVDTLVIAQGQERLGVRCEKCGFVFGREVDKCPYDGSPVKADVDMVEAVIRLAEEHGSEIEFVPGEDLEKLAGVGALLRY